MKRPLFIMLFAALTACNSTSVVNTPTIAPTLTPIPTSTVTPVPTPTETVTPISEIFAPMELGTADKPGKCTFDDIQSGRYAWNARQQAEPFSADIKNTGWKPEGGTHQGHLTLKVGNFGVEQTKPFVCEVVGDFFGLQVKPGELYIITIPVKNTDGTTGFLNLLAASNTEINKERILKALVKSKGTGVGVIRSLNQTAIESALKSSKYKFGGQLWKAQGVNNITREVNNLEDSGIISAEMERMIFIPSIPGY